MSVGSFLFNIEVVLHHIKIHIMYYSNKMDSGYYILIDYGSGVQDIVVGNILYLGREQYKH